MRFRRRGDLALLETALIGLAVVTAGVVFGPDTFSEQSKGKPLEVYREIHQIGEAVLRFQNDTAYFSEGVEKGEFIGILYGQGEIPDATIWESSEDESIASLLVQNQPSLPNWKGPYLPKVNADPWGRAYLVSVSSFRFEKKRKVWVLSAGPNGVLETGLKDKLPSGDDLGVVIY